MRCSKYMSCFMGKGTSACPIISSSYSLSLRILSDLYPHVPLRYRCWRICLSECGITNIYAAKIYSNLLPDCCR